MILKEFLRKLMYRVGVFKILNLLKKRLKKVIIKLQIIDMKITAE